MSFDHYMNVLKVISISEACGYLNPPNIERKFWVSPINENRENGERFRTFYHDIRQSPDKFFEYHRMSLLSFDERSYITKKVTQFCNPISAKEQLTLTIRLVHINISIQFT